MSFQWLQMRIGEEQDRRQREADILARLGPALDEIQSIIGTCLDAYSAAFGADSANIRRESGVLAIRVGNPPGEVRVTADPEVPGFQVARKGSTMTIEIGILPGEKLFYRDRGADQYLTMDELTRRILDRVLFPKLRE